jgi:malate synthase
MNVFDQHMPTKSNSRKTEDIKVTEQDLLETKGTITVEGIRKNISISVLYLASWLNGQGAAALHT